MNRGLRAENVFEHGNKHFISPLILYIKKKQTVLSKMSGMRIIGAEKMYQYWNRHISQTKTSLPEL